MNTYLTQPLIIVRGAGDIATGTIHRLVRCGYWVLCLETNCPTSIRRNVSFSEAVYEGLWEVEGVKAVLVSGIEQAVFEMKQGNAAVMIDPLGSSITSLKPDIVIDAILAKKNLGTRLDMARLTIALGPGFTAGEDVSYVIETMRGHDLGKIIAKGKALSNTGIPGNIAGYTKERVIYAAAKGKIASTDAIGTIVMKGDVIADIITDQGIKHRVTASISGVLRGIIREGYYVTKGLKIADIDPRMEEVQNCSLISDKARCIAGSVLELVVRSERGITDEDGEC